MKINGIILAAGSASRMGKVKQLLPYKNSSLLNTAIYNAENASLNKIYCVLGSNAELIRYSLKDSATTFIYNSNYLKGLSSSIVSGVQYVLKEDPKTDAILITLADQPFADAAYLNLILKEAYKFPNTLIASDYGSSNGVPALFPKSTFPELLSLSGDKGAKTLLNKIETQVVHMNSNSSHVLFDVDTPRDYENLLKI